MLSGEATPGCQGKILSLVPLLQLQFQLQSHYPSPTVSVPVLQWIQLQFRKLYFNTSSVAFQVQPHLLSQPYNSSSRVYPITISAPALLPILLPHTHWVSHSLPKPHSSYPSPYTPYPNPTIVLSPALLSLCLCQFCCVSSSFPLLPAKSCSWFLLHLRAVDKATNQSLSSFKYLYKLLLPSPRGPLLWWQMRSKPQHTSSTAHPLWAHSCTCPQSLANGHQLLGVAN